MAGVSAFLQLPKEDNICIQNFTIYSGLNQVHDRCFCIFTVAKKEKLSENVTTST